MKNILTGSLFNKKSDSQIFHEATKLTNFSTESRPAVIPKSWTQVFYKGYPRFEKFPLPRAIDLNKISLGKIMRFRHSEREFSKRDVSLSDLSSLLFYTAGLKNLRSNDSGNRFYPSAGARYPNEVYPVIFNVEEQKMGIYHYHLRTHSLEYMWDFPNFEKIILSTFNQEWINKASLLLAITAVFGRTTMKYEDRGYRHVLVDTGHFCQNIYLICEALGLGCCSIGGFIDDKLNSLLDVDGQEESVIIVVAIGTKK